MLEIRGEDFVTRTTQLMVARGSNGTKLAWESKSNELYTVQIRDGLYQNSRWINHPSLVQIRGTGERIEFVDHPGPTEKRKYNLKTLDLNKPMPSGAGNRDHPVPKINKRDWR